MKKQLSETCQREGSALWHNGIRPAVVALVTSACMGLFLEPLFHKVQVKGKALSPIVFIVAPAVLGVAFQL